MRMTVLSRNIYISKDDENNCDKDDCPIIKLSIEEKKENSCTMKTSFNYKNYGNKGGLHVSDQTS